jgi:chromosome segregation ATPase
MVQSNLNVQKKALEEKKVSLEKLKEYQTQMNQLLEKGNNVLQSVQQINQNGLNGLQNIAQSINRVLP